MWVPRHHKAHQLAPQKRACHTIGRVVRVLARAWKAGFSLALGSSSFPPRLFSHLNGWTRARKKLPLYSRSFPVDIPGLSPRTRDVGQTLNDFEWVWVRRRYEGRPIVWDACQLAVDNHAALGLNVIAYATPAHFAMLSPGQHPLPPCPMLAQTHHLTNADMLPLSHLQTDSEDT